MDLNLEMEKFRREVAVRNGTDKDALLILFAYSTEAALPKPPLIDYVEAFLGPAKKRASEPNSYVLSNGTVKFRIAEAGTGSGGQHFVKVLLTPPTVLDINSMLAGSHPLAKSSDSKDFTWECGKELCHLTVEFDDASMVIAVTKGVDYVGVEHYLVRNGDMIDTCGAPIRQSTILGRYELRGVDEEAGRPNPPTHVVEIAEGN